MFLLDLFIYKVQKSQFIVFGSSLNLFIYLQSTKCL
jgi:hypothetical protein